MYKKNRLSVFANCGYLRPKLLSMKLSVILMFSGILQVSAYTYGQKVTIRQKNVTLTNVLKDIQKQSGYNILYESTLVPKFSKLDVNLQNEDVEKSLSTVLNTHNLTYKIVDKNVILTRKVDMPRTGKMDVEVEAVQQRVISGKVVNENAENLGNVSVSEKGTQNATMTDDMGNYTLTVSSSLPELVFSFVGYERLEVPAGSRVNVDVTMSPMQSGLDEVVVVGYGTQKRATVTGAVAVVKGEELAKVPTTNVIGSMAGRLSGVTINTRGGNPGSEAININIRGKSTWQGGSPLIIVDGIPNRSGWERINPSDIESISVLKDASAAIYGSRAANGVILVTTKRGTQGKTSLEYKGDFGFTQVTRIPDMARSYEYAQYYTEAKRSGYIFTPDELEKFKSGADQNLFPNYELNDYVLSKGAPQMTHSLSLRGGSEKTRFYLSGRYLDQDAVYKSAADNFKSYNILSNLDMRVMDNLNVGVNLTGRRDDKIRAVGSSETNGFFEELLGTDPSKPIFFKNGYPAPIYDKNLVEQIKGMNGVENRGATTFTSLVTAKWDLPFITTGLFLEGTAAYDFANTRVKQFSKSYDLYAYNSSNDTYSNLNTNPVGNRSLYDYYFNSYKYTINGRLGYNKRFNDLHDISAFVAYEQYETSDEWISANRTSFLTDQIPYLFMGGAENQRNDGSGYEFAYRNLFGRLAYNFADKYLFDFTLRRDESMRFAEGNRVGVFPGLSAGWILSKESFITNNYTFINNLKLRASWGLMGSDNVAEYQYLASAALRGETSSAVFGSDPKVAPTVYLTGLPNPDITWEVANSSNIALEGSLWNNVLSFEIEYFFTKRDKILATRNASIPLYAGITLPQENIGKAKNQGLELVLNYHKINGEFRYGIGANFSHTKNEIVYMDESAFTPAYQRQEGHAIDSWLLYRTDGIFNTEAELEATAAKRADAKVGDIKYLDIDGDGAITDNDQVRLFESSMPRYIFGVPIQLGYRNFEFEMLWQGQAGAKTYINPTSRNGDINVPMWIYNDRWTEATAETATMPRAFYHRSETYNSLASDFWLKDASFIRLKSAQIAYTLPQSVVNKIGASELRIYGSGFNLLLFDKIKNYDPEVVNNLGVFYPSSRVYNLGVQLTF